MARYLSQEWLDRHRELAAGQPEWPGVSARLQYVVTGTPDGDVRYHTVVRDGRLVEAALGDIADPDVTFTQGYEVNLQILRGDLDANAAFMQGRVKVAGDMGKVLDLLPLTSDPDYRRVQEQLVAETDL